MNYDAFADEYLRIQLEKEAGLFGAAMGAAKGAIRGVGKRTEGVRASARHAYKGWGKGGSKALEREMAMARGLPESAVRDAKVIANQLRAKGIDPSKARIAITGTGGTGKSTMGKALEAELGMPMREMDQLVPKHPIMGRNWHKTPKLEQGHIYEQTHLLSGVSPDKFDVLVHLEKPVDQIRKQTLKRGRGAYQLDAYDYPKFQRGVRSAFSNTAGNQVEISGSTIAKIKPEGGFQADKVLNENLRSMGINPTGLSRQTRVISAAEGAVPVAPGILPYFGGAKGSIRGRIREGIKKGLLK